MMILIILIPLSLLTLGLPLLHHLLLITRPSLNILHQRIHSPIPPIIRHNPLPLAVPPQSRKCQNPFVLTQLSMRHTIHLPHPHTNRRILPHLPREQFPRRLQTLTPYAPRSVKVHDGPPAVPLEKILQTGLVERNGVRFRFREVLMHGLVVVFVLYGALSSVPSGEFANVSAVVEMVFDNVFGYVL